MNSSLTICIFQGYGVVLFVGEEADDAAASVGSRYLANLHRQTADLFAFLAEKQDPG